MAKAETGKKTPKKQPRRGNPTECSVVERPLSPQDKQYDEIDALLREKPKDGNWLVKAMVMVLESLQWMRNDINGLQAGREYDQERIQGAINTLDSIKPQLHYQHGPSRNVILSSEEIQRMMQGVK